MSHQFFHIRGQRYCWASMKDRLGKNSNILTIGSNIYGQLGVGNKLGESRQFVPVLFTDNIKTDTGSGESQSGEAVVAKKIACGANHTIILTDNGQVYSWGCNQNAALGRSGDDFLPGLVEIPIIPLNINFAAKKGLSPVNGTMDYIIQIGCTESASFVLTEGGMLFGWGVFCDKTAPIGFLRRETEGVGNLPGPSQVTGSKLKKKINKVNSPKKNKKETARSLKKGQLVPVAKPVSRPVLLADHVLEFSTGKNHLVYKGLEGIFSIGTNLYGESGFQPQKRRSKLEHLVPSLLANKRCSLYKYDFLYCGPYTTYFVNGQEITAFGKNTDGQLGLGNFISGSMRRKTYLSVETDKIVIKKEKDLEHNRLEIIDKIFFSEHSRTAQKKKENILRKKENISGNRNKKKISEGNSSFKRHHSELDKQHDFESDKRHHSDHDNTPEQKQKNSEIDGKKPKQQEDSEEEMDFKVNGIEVEGKKTIKHESIIKIKCGESHALFLTASGNVYGTGSNELRQLGNHIEKRRFNDPKLIANNMVDIKASGFTTFLQSKNGVWHSLGMKRNEIPINELNDLYMRQKDRNITDIQLGHDFMVIIYENC